MQIQNLITFFLAVENIFVDEMQFYPEPPITRKERRFGFLVNSVFYIQSEFEVNDLSKQFVKLNRNRQLMTEQIRLEQMLHQKEKNKNKFKPSLNQKSQELAAKNRTIQL